MVGDGMILLNILMILGCGGRVDWFKSRGWFKGLKRGAGLKVGITAEPKTTN